MSRRLISLTVPAVALVCVLSPVTSAAASTPAAVDRLQVTVAGSGGSDGTYELTCHPAGGTHPDASKACERLDEVTVWGTDPFASVPKDAMCTMQYGGPATAHIEGTWQGRPVEATYDRSNGCEIARWDALIPVLPATSA